MYSVRLMNLPTSVRSFVKMQDGFPTIVLNSKLSQEMQKDCYEHEVRHLQGNDFEKQDASGIEFVAHERMVDS